MRKTAEGFIGKSQVFISVLERASRLRGRSANVLIIGKSGTGKELLAKYIHGLENNPSRPFVAVNCAAIPEQLLESELFGHEKGAFTGAIDRKIGKFELANGGDVFLDEISTLKPALQAKLLRVLQDKMVCRLGSNISIKSNFRVIAATSECLVDSVVAGDFREDLYHRLAIVTLAMPSLKERREDIPMLVEHLLSKYLQAGESKTISNDVMAFFHDYDWPGNIRELENLIHNLVIMTPKEIIDIEDVDQCLSKNSSYQKNVVKIVGPCSMEGRVQPLKNYLESAKEKYILQTMQTIDWNRSKAAKFLGINRTTLHKYLDSMKLDEITLEPL